jgi:hypothetical protein
MMDLLMIQANKSVVIKTTMWFKQRSIAWLSAPTKYMFAAVNPLIQPETFTSWTTYDNIVRQRHMKILSRQASSLHPRCSSLHHQSSLRTTRLHP